MFLTLHDVRCQHRQPHDPAHVATVQAQSLGEIRDRRVLPAVDQFLPVERPRQRRDQRLLGGGLRRPGGETFRENDLLSWSSKRWTSKWVWDRHEVESGVSELSIRC